MVVNNYVHGEKVWFDKIVCKFGCCFSFSKKKIGMLTLPSFHLYFSLYLLFLSNRKV